MLKKYEIIWEKHINRERYKEKYNKQPKGWEYDKETMQEYEKYLEKESEK